MVENGAKSPYFRCIGEGLEISADFLRFVSYFAGKLAAEEEKSESHTGAV